MALFSSDLTPTSKNVLNQRFRAVHDIIMRKNGALTADDEEFQQVKNVFRDIPVFKDIPSNFRLEVSDHK